MNEAASAGPALRHVVIVGATSLIAEYCARLWSSDPCHFILAGRDRAKLDRIAQDLRTRNPKSFIECQTPSFDDPQEIARFSKTIFEGSTIDVALIAHGSLPDQSGCQNDLAMARDAMFLNAISPALFAEGLAARMEAASRGALVVIGSVAGDRGRRSNYVYGAAKGLLERYVQGLQHRFAGSGVQVTLVKPGPTDTPMTADLRRPGVRLADPKLVARDIVRGVRAGTRVVYTPRVWRLIMLVIRHIPDRIFDRLSL